MDAGTVLTIINLIDSEINAIDMMIAKEQWITQAPNTRIIALDGQLKVLLVLKNTIQCRLDDYNESQLNALENQSPEQ